MTTITVARGLPQKTTRTLTMMSWPGRGSPDTHHGQLKTTSSDGLLYYCAKLWSSAVYKVAPPATLQAAGGQYTCGPEHRRQLSLYSEHHHTLTTTV